MPNYFFILLLSYLLRTEHRPQLTWQLRNIFQTQLLFSRHLPAIIRCFNDVTVYADRCQIGVLVYSFYGALPQKRVYSSCTREHLTKGTVQWNSFGCKWFGCQVHGCQVVLNAGSIFASTEWAFNFYLRAKRSASQWIINMRSEGQGWFTFLEYFVNSDIKRPEKHANIGFQGRTAQFRGQIWHLRS